MPKSCPSECLHVAPRIQVSHARRHAFIELAECSLAQAARTPVQRRIEPLLARTERHPRRPPESGRLPFLRQQIGLNAYTLHRNLKRPPSE